MRRFTSMLGSLALGAALVAPASLAGAASPPEQPPAATPEVPVSETGSYVVLLKGDPLAARMDQDDLRSDQASARGREMRQQHAAVARTAQAEPVNQYTVALHGFSTIVEHEQAEQLAAHKDVLMVLPDELRQPTTDSSIEFLGLTGGTGSEPAAHDAGIVGEDVVVGVVDTGIWPEHPSFADTDYRPMGQVDVPCEFGNTEHNSEDAPFSCNDKLLGARQMLETYRALIGAEDFEFDSARDDNGHGTHTASTAAGNADVPASVGVHDLGTVSGVAPRARVIAYKGLGALGGFSSDLAAAIDQAVADGVDVINYSIGGGPGLLGADEIAFLFAADAGVHVATSAGNTGPGAGTIGGPGSAPWLTTVGASTQTRFFEGTVELGDGRTFTGASLTDELADFAPLVDAEDATADGDDLCVPGTLDPDVVEGSVVLCRRGEIARVDKSLAVLQAGGVGMVMYENSDSGDRFTDTHHVPSVHVDNTEGLAMKAYIDAHERPGRGRGNGPPGQEQATARIVDTGTASTFDPAPSMTSFSSRGPDPVAEDIIKPDVTAPGMQILAGASPYADPNGNDFQSIAGTSMSSPHVAGLFALLDQVHPDWSPATSRSALMTTAHQDVRDNDRTTPANPFEMGAGHVDPGAPAAVGSSFDPGLAYEAGFNEYLGFLCDAAPEAFADPAATCTSLASDGVPTEAENLNLPSIGVSSVPGTKTITRTVTSVASGRHTYTVDVDAPEGFDVTVEPSTFTARPGQEVTYSVTFDTVDAEIGDWRFGELTWSSGSHDVTSPIAARASRLEAPAEVTGSGADGSVSFDVSFGYTGQYTAAGHGLVPATVFADEVQQDDDQTFQPSDAVEGGAVAHEVTTTDAALLRFAIPPDGVVDPAIDIDVFVHDSSGNLVGSSTNGGTDEVVELTLPEDDTYTVYVHGWQTVQPSTTVTSYLWVVSAVPNAAGDGLTVTAPQAATLGEAGTVEASWTGATDGWYLGAVSHSDADGIMATTLVEVDNR